MYAAKSKGRLTLTIEPGERRLLQRVLEAIIQNYETPPEALPAPVAQVWYSTAGCRSARMSAEQTREWIGQLRAIRKSRLRLLRRCGRAMRSASKKSAQVRMSTDEAAELMTSLNDHRLFLAARHDIGEAEMNWPFFALPEALKPAQRKALFEIGVLAFMIEILLSAIDPDAANWRE